MAVILCVFCEKEPELLTPVAFVDSGTMLVFDAGCFDVTGTLLICDVFCTGLVETLLVSDGAERLVVALLIWLSCDADLAEILSVCTTGFVDVAATPFVCEDTFVDFLVPVDMVGLNATFAVVLGFVGVPDCCVSLVLVVPDLFAFADVDGLSLEVEDCTEVVIVVSKVPNVVVGALPEPRELDRIEELEFDVDLNVEVSVELGFNVVDDACKLGMVVGEMVRLV